MRRGQVGAGKISKANEKHNEEYSVFADISAKENQTQNVLVSKPVLI